MSRTLSAATPPNRVRRPTTVGLLLAVATIVVAVAYNSAASSERSSSAAAHGVRTASPVEADGVVTEADGSLPDGATVFDVAYPGVARMSPDLLTALRKAATDAADDGIEIRVNSGWRSPDYQQQLLVAAVAEYGSIEEAARWVASPDTSAHVSGHAVDIGPFEATAWLSEHGADYGLCQVYGNEAWHFELRPEAIDRVCPAMYPDPTHDPRMQP